MYNKQNDGTWAETTRSSGSGGGDAAKIAQIENAVNSIEPLHRVTSLDSTVFAAGTYIETVGIPDYLDATALSGQDMAAYQLSEPGWYIFPRIMAPDGVITDTPVVEGAAGYTVGENYVDLAVRFGVLGASVPVLINWGSKADSLVFKATDLG